MYAFEYENYTKIRLSRNSRFNEFSGYLLYTVQFSLVLEYQNLHIVKITFESRRQFNFSMKLHHCGHWRSAGTGRKYWTQKSIYFIMYLLKKIVSNDIYENIF